MAEGNWRRGLQIRQSEFLLGLRWKSGEKTNTKELARFKVPDLRQVELCRQACSLAGFGEIHLEKANSFRRFRFTSRPRFAKPPIIEQR